MRGPTVGATVEGQIDYAENEMRMRGTFVPLYGINNAFGQFPIVGLFLGGSNEGLVGITYEVVGPPGAPVLRVNPISAVAPGLLRKFFEFPGATGPAPRSCRTPRRRPFRCRERDAQTGFSRTCRLRPSDSLITPSGVRSFGVSVIFSSVTVTSLTFSPPPLI